MEDKTDTPGVVVVSARTADGADAPLDPRFGRAAYFAVVDVAAGTYESVVNPGVNAGHGAGTQAVAFAVSRGAQAVISGEFGPKASTGLAAARITPYRAPEGTTVGDAVKKLLAGDLTPFVLREFR